jgi:hypothetical protein
VYEDKGCHPSSFRHALALSILKRRNILLYLINLFVTRSLVKKLTGTYSHLFLGYGLYGQKLEGVVIGDFRVKRQDKGVLIVVQLETDLHD